MDVQIRPPKPDDAEGLAKASRDLAMTAIDLGLSISFTGTASSNRIGSGLPTTQR